MTASTRSRGALPCAGSALTATAAAVLVLFAGSSRAQSEPAQTVTVTGIRGAIESAISVKKNADNIVEAVSAEDIGKLPDTSIAESIARLPGVAAQRVEGRASAVSIRGFGPDFSTTLLNGREQVSTGDSRFVEYDQYPSELLSGVTIYKTPDGRLVGQGLAGTVELQTVRPLDSGQRQFAINYRREKLGTGLSTPSGSGSRFNVAYIDQFADRTLGVAIGFARLDETTGTSQNYGSWGVADICPTPPPAGQSCQSPTVKAPGGFNDLVDKTEQTRNALMATLQYKPSKSFSTSVDVFVTKFDQTKLEQGLQMPLAFGQNYGPASISATTISGGVATAGQIDGFKPLSRNDVDANHDKVHSVGWNGRLSDLGGWTAEADLNVSDAKRNAPHLETTAGMPGDCKTTPTLCGTLTWTGFDGNSPLSAHYTLPYSLTGAAAQRLTDVEGWGGGPGLPQAGYTKTAHTDDKLKALRLGGKRDLPEGMFFSDLDVGVNYADREKTRTYVEGRLVIAGSSDPYASVAVPGAINAVAPASGIPYTAWNPDGSVGSVYAIAPKLVPDIANKNWQVQEKVTTAFARLNIDSTLLGLPVRGNAGLQLVHTDQGSTAFSTNGQSSCPADNCATTTTHDGATFYDVLPSLNLVADLGNGQTLRLGLARQMARPTLDDMRASLEFSVNNQVGLYTGTAGNPKLKPFRANALDVSYEKYWATKAYVSAAGFYKDLATYIIRSPGLFDFTPYVTSQTAPSPSGDNVGILTRPVNGSGGSVKGLEFAGSFPLAWGFGMQAGYAYTKSSVVLPITGVNAQNIASPTIPLPGLSKNVVQLTVYYEAAGFEARLGSRYRSNFVGNITDQIGDQRLVNIKGERITDAQLSYNFQGGPLKGLSILFQANNIRNEPYIEYRDVPADISKRIEYGKTYLLGVNYKM